MVEKEITVVCVCCHVHRTSFYYNPALQTRSFLMLGVISEKTRKISLLVSKTLKVLEETLHRREEDVELLEAIVSCLTHFVPLLDHSCDVCTRYFICIVREWFVVHLARVFVVSVLPFFDVHSSDALIILGSWIVVFYGGLHYNSEVYSADDTLPFLIHSYNNQTLLW